MSSQSVTDTAPAPRADGESAGRANHVVALICGFGLVVTALAMWVAVRTDRTTEQRLLETQSRQAANVLAASVSEIDLSHFFAAAALLYGGAFVAERYAAIRDLIESRPEVLDPTTRKIIEKARDFSAADLFADLERLAELRRETAAVWHDIDILVVPSIPTPVTRAEIAEDPLGPNARLGTYTNFVNLLDLCALAVPGRDVGGEVLGFGRGHVAEVGAQLQDGVANLDCRLVQIQGRLAA